MTAASFSVQKPWLLPWKVLAFLALAFWFTSLFFTALVVYEQEPDLYSGLYVLQTGWLGAFAFNFAWYANLLLLACIACLFTRKFNGKRLCIKLAFSAVLLALFSFCTTIKYDLGYMAGGFIVVIGYGWGFLFWWISLLLLLAAAVAHFLTFSQSRKNKFILSVVCVAIVLSCIAIMLHGVVNGLMDSKAQRYDLKGGLFLKNGFADLPICTDEVPAVLQRIKNFSGIVEYIDSGDMRQRWHAIVNLLDMGVGAVQTNGKEFRRFSFQDGFMVYAITDSTTKAGVTIERKDTRERDNSTWQITIVDKSNNTIIFDGRWKSEAVELDGQYLEMTCPAWKVYSPLEGRRVDYARQKIIEALSREIYFAWRATARGGERIVEQYYASSLRMLAELPQEQVSPSKLVSPLACPADVGWLPENEAIALRKEVRIGQDYFRLRDLIYSDPINAANYSYCSFDHVYFYRDYKKYNDPKGRFIKITKRRLSDFEVVWIKHIHYTLPLEEDIDSVTDCCNTSVLMLNSLHDGDGLQLFMTNSQTGQHFEITTSPEQELKPSEL